MAPTKEAANHLCLHLLRSSLAYMGLDPRSHILKVMARGAPIVAGGDIALTNLQVAIQLYPFHSAFAP